MQNAFTAGGMSVCFAVCVLRRERVRGVLPGQSTLMKSGVCVCVGVLGLQKRGGSKRGLKRSES